MKRTYKDLANDQLADLHRAALGLTPVTVVRINRSAENLEEYPFVATRTDETPDVISWWIEDNTMSVTDSVLTVDYIAAAGMVRAFRIGLSGSAKSEVMTTPAPDFRFPVSELRRARLKDLIRHLQTIPDQTPDMAAQIDNDCRDYAAEIAGIDLFDTLNGYIEDGSVVMYTVDGRPGFLMREDVEAGADPVVTETIKELAGLMHESIWPEPDFEPNE